MQHLTIPILKLPHAADLPLPEYATSGSVGMDVVAAVSADVVIPPLRQAMIPTGISVELPEGYELQIRPRSGLTAKHCLTILNSPVTIDCDFRGEMMVLLYNLGQTDFTVTRGLRIAQFVIAPFVRATWQPTEKLSETQRGAGGFGSTGMSVKTGT